LQKQSDDKEHYLIKKGGQTPKKVLKVAHIRSELDLSSEEAQHFLPVYKGFEAKMAVFYKARRAERKKHKTEGEIAFIKYESFKKAGKYGDFSYGMYVYAFPVQQTIIYIFSPDIPISFMIVASLTLTFPFAYLSLHLIENPSNRLRYNYYKLFTPNHKFH